MQMEIELYCEALLKFHEWFLGEMVEIVLEKNRETLQKIFAEKQFRNSGRICLISASRLLTLASAEKHNPEATLSPRSNDDGGNDDGGQSRG